MTRNIKYRAFNGKEMRYEVSLNSHKNTTCKAVRSGYMWFNEGNDIYNSELMQFTGFTDKNGKEIFEGDILSDFTNTDEGIKKSHQQVFWDKLHGAWKLDFSFKQDKSEGAFLHNELATFKYEISGNIYENANLIAQK